MHVIACNCMHAYGITCNYINLHLEGWVMLYNMLYNRVGVISHLRLYNMLYNTLLYNTSI